MMTESLLFVHGVENNTIGELAGRTLRERFKKT